MAISGKYLISNSQDFSSLTVAIISAKFVIVQVEIFDSKSKLTLSIDGLPFFLEYQLHHPPNHFHDWHVTSKSVNKHQS